MNERVWRLYGSSKKYLRKLPLVGATIAAYKKRMANSTQSNHHKQCSMPRCGEPHAVENRIGLGKKQSKTHLPPLEMLPQHSIYKTCCESTVLPRWLLPPPVDVAMPKSSGQLSPLSMASVRPEASSEQSILAELLPGVVLGRLPDGQAECDLVHEVGEIVHQIERVVVHTAHEISEVIAQGVDGPTDRDNQTHGVERALDMRLTFSSPDATFP